MRPARGHTWVCPWWLGYFLVSPLRGLFEKPEQLLAPYVKAGMRVLELGSGMGYYSLPAARMVGSGGGVLCLDVQRRMLAGLVRRARRAGLLETIETRLCGAEDLGLSDRLCTIDLALLIHVLHEIPDPGAALEQVAETLKPEGRLLLIEPGAHVSKEVFERELALAPAAGLELETRLDLRRRHGAVLRPRPLAR